MNTLASENVFLDILILVPTSIELQRIRRVWRDRVLAVGQKDDAVFRLSESAVGRAELVGFGPIASAARTAGLIAKYQPRRALLLGIAGTYSDDGYPVGAAAEFDRVICDGVGIGQSDSFRSASSIRWPQFRPEPTDGHQLPLIEDSIDLIASVCSDDVAKLTLLTVCSASACVDDADRRRRRFPNVIGEDMEGFGVAMACRLANLPLQIIRGFSNRVGDRDVNHWQIDAAIHAAAELAISRCIEEDEQG